MMKNWTVKPTIRYLPAVIAIGIALGVASHAIGFESGLVESVILHMITALLIGSGLIFVVTNADLVSPESSESIRSVIFGLLFMVIGVVAAEIEVGLRTVFFGNGSYQPFAGEGIYLFDAIIAIILGFGMFTTLRNAVKPDESAGKDPAEHLEPLSTLPVKKGDSIHLLPLGSVCLLEAADKYAYVYNTAGEKYLCDYSLAQLENRLPRSFERIHRSHIVNVEHITTIQAFDKKRYTLSFSSNAVPAVRSSAGYQEKVRGMIKI